MRVYVDSSALLKRVFQEDGSTALVLAFDDRLAYACAANDLAVTIPGRD